MYDRVISMMMALKAADKSKKSNMGAFTDSFPDFGAEFDQRGSHSSRSAGVYMDEAVIKARVAACGLDFNTTEMFVIGRTENLVLVPAYAKKRLKCSLNFDKIPEIMYEQEYTFRV